MQQESDTVKIFLVKTTVSNFVSSLYVIYIFSVYTYFSGGHQSLFSSPTCEHTFYKPRGF